MTQERNHTCGRSMVPGIFGNHDPVPAYRSQHVLLCNPCNAWEPDETWRGDLPDEWDGQRWIADTAEVNQ